VGGQRFGIYIPRELLRELEEIMRAIGARSKSKVIQEALRTFIAEQKWKTAGKAVGIIGVVYNHDVDDIDAKLTDIQHQFLDIIVSTLHVHLDRERCLLAIVVKGDASRVRDLYNTILGLDGVISARPMLLAID